MKLGSLIKQVNKNKLINFKNVNITNLSIRANEIEKNGLFFAIKGNNFDGASFIYQAISNGAKAVITEKEIKDIEIPQVIVDDIRIALAIISKTFFNKCDEKLKIIEVVGTNGKTTTSTIIYNILRAAGKKVGLIGTNGIKIDELNLPNILTTPDPIDLFYTFEQMLTFGVEYVVMEVSAHAIYYNKVYGINPEIVVFTNISNEHLDFFGTMEKYSQVKLNYIKNLNSKKIINIDDEWGRELLKLNNVWTYGILNPADTFAINIEMQLDNLKFVCNVNDEILNIESKLIGSYNVYNLMAGILTAKILKIDNEIIDKSIKNLKKVDGRWEVFDFPNNNKVIIDYAHTPDGFLKVFETVKKIRKGRIITLFGCVGYSDKNKRKMMGDIAKKYSDFVIITSDNYSDESFDEIFNDIGIDKFYAKIKERNRAVDFAINMLDKNDTLLLLGKGAEKTQKSKNGDSEYDEIEYVKKYLKG